MQVAVERRPGSKAALTITVEPEVLGQKTEQLFQQQARRVAIPGFRPGKAPRRLLEERINMQMVQQDAVEALIDITYKQALDEENLQPLERGEVEDINVADDLTLVYTVLVSVRPEVTLPDYNKITITHEKTVVTEETVDNEIERVRERLSEYQEITDAGIEKDDYVTIDYTLKINGEDYPDDTVAGYPLEVGTDTLFSELNEALLGLKVGETTTIDKKYPADYSDDHLAGNEVNYLVTIQQIRRKVKPDANDEWAKSVTQGAVDTMEELRSRVKENLQSAALQGDRDAIRNQLVRKLVEGSTLELPETLLEEEYEHLMAHFESELLQTRRSLEEYLDENSMTEEQYQSSQRILAKDMVRRSLVLQEVGSQESLFVTQQEIDNMLRQLDDNISIKDMRKELEKSGHLDSLASRIFHEKVLSFLESKVNIVIEGEEDGEKIADEDTSETAIAEPATEVAAATEIEAEETTTDNN